LNILPLWILLALAIGCDDAATRPDASDATAVEAAGDASYQGQPCHGFGDCGQLGDYYCRVPLATSAFEQPCGAPCQQFEECASDADCRGETPLCLSYLDDCCQIGEYVSTLCAPVCTDDAACGQGRRCRGDGRGCEVIPCDQGSVCPEHTECRPAESTQPVCEAYEWDCRAGEREHGCIRQACQSDVDCGALFCVCGRCYESLGTCDDTPI